jgi:hypothetical protein
VDRWGFVQQGLLIITLGVFQYDAVINFCPIGDSDKPCFNPFPVPLSGAVIVNIIAVYGVIRDVETRRYTVVMPFPSISRVNKRTLEFMSSLRARSKDRMQGWPSNCSMVRVSSSHFRQLNRLKYAARAHPDIQVFRFEYPGHAGIIFGPALLA